MRRCLEGAGVFRWPDGRRLEGRFRMDFPVEGELTDSNGDIFQRSQVVVFDHTPPPHWKESPAVLRLAQLVRVSTLATRAALALETDQTRAALLRQHHVATRQAIGAGSGQGGALGGDIEDSAVGEKNSCISEKKLQVVGVKVLATSGSVAIQKPAWWLALVASKARSAAQGPVTSCDAVNHDESLASWPPRTLRQISADCLEVCTQGFSEERILCCGSEFLGRLFLATWQWDPARLNSEFKCSSHSTTPHKDLQFFVRELDAGDKSKFGEAKLERWVRRAIEAHCAVNRHPSFVRLLGGAILTGPRVLLAYRFGRGDSLRNVLDVHSSSFPPLARGEAAARIAAALAHLAHAGFLHGRLTSSGVFVSSAGQVVVANLEFAVYCSLTNGGDGFVAANADEEMPPPALGYSCPRFLKTGKFCERAMVYALGVLFLELATGQRPDGSCPQVVDASSVASGAESEESIPSKIRSSGFAQGAGLAEHFVEDEEELLEESLDHRCGSWFTSQMSAAAADALCNAARACAGRFRDRPSLSGVTKLFAACPFAENVLEPVHNDGGEQEEFEVFLEQNSEDHLGQAENLSQSKANMNLNSRLSRLGTDDFQVDGKNTSNLGVSLAEEGQIDEEICDDWEFSYSKGATASAKVADPHDERKTPSLNSECPSYEGRTCVICLEFADSNPSGIGAIWCCGVPGQPRHATCTPCFSQHVQNESLADLESLVAGARRGQMAGRIPCPMSRGGGCSSEPFTDQQIALHVSGEVYEEYMQAQRRVIERRVVQTLGPEIEQRMRSQIRQDRISTHREHILQNILTLRCPNKDCRQAFIDFDGCFALTCSRCDTAFCAYCLWSAGTRRLEAAHLHVSRCPKNISSDRGLFSDFSVFESAQRARRVRCLAGFLRGLPGHISDAVVMSCEKELEELGLLTEIQAAGLFQPMTRD